MQLAEEAMPRTLNEMLLGTGDGLIAALTGDERRVGRRTQTLTVGTAANFYQLYPGRTATSSSAPRSRVRARLGRGHDPVRERVGRHDRRPVRRRLEHVVRGDNTMGLYLEGVAGQAAGSLLACRAPAGRSRDRLVRGHRQGREPGLAGHRRPQRRHVRRRPVDLDHGRGIRRRGRNGTPDSSYWVADPAVLDRFSQTLLTQSRWAGDAGELKTGFKYLEYRDERLYPEYDAKAQTIWNVPLDDMTFYATQNGPDWDDEDGSIFKRFNRSLPIEAWLIDEYQIGFHRLNRLVYADNLNQAA
jgi:hypothetical protein